nr:MAG TPA: hypothetical protein [Caudoviricetes sp.]
MRARTCARARVHVTRNTLPLSESRARVAPVGQPDVAITRPTPDFDTERNHQMARKVRPVHCWGIMKRDFIEIKGLGDCRVLSDPRYSCESLDIIQFWVMTPTYKPLLIALSEDSYLNVVEFIDDEDEEFTEEIERVMMCELRRGDKFYFGQRKHTFFYMNLDRTAVIRTAGGRRMDLRVSPFKVVRRARKVRKTKPLSFTEFALSSYEKALGKLAKAVMGLQLDPARVEVQKPAKKAENASPVITTKDVPSPTPVVPEDKPCACKCARDEDCDRSYCVEFDASKITAGTIDSGNVRTRYSDDHVLTCSDVIAELEEVRQHEGDLPVSIVSPEDGFRRVNVSGSMLEDLYEHGETYWGSRTWDTQPRPGSPDDDDPTLVISLW